MPLDNEQAKLIKEQLLMQVSKLPEAQKEQAEKYISSLSNEALEQFLKQNKISMQQQKPKPLKNECIFCAIANKQVDSFYLYEDKDYVAVLEINPYSEGHTIIIPKKHLKESKLISSKAFTISNKVGKHIIKKIKAENFIVNTSSDLNHSIINIIPIFKDKQLTYERKPLNQEQLKSLAMKIGALIKPEKKVKIKKENKQDSTNKEIIKLIIQLPRRIP